MKLKNVALLVAALTCIAGSTALAAEKVSIKSANADSYDVVQVMTTKDKDYYQYYNRTYQYAVDIPRSATTADMTVDGDGAYFQDPKDDAVFRTYAAKNAMGFSIDELYNMAVGMNESPELTTNIKTKDSYAIGWTDGKTSYYHELYLNDKDKTYVAFTVTYPTDKRDKYQAIISHMSRTFLPNVQM
ncbi:MAG: hypothetical protein U0J30_10575 [Megasphaera sp.]|nr:hypothetical protein [Megasphaera sp.]